MSVYEIFLFDSPSKELKNGTFPVTLKLPLTGSENIILLKSGANRNNGMLKKQGLKKAILNMNCKIVFY